MSLATESRASTRARLLVAALVFLGALILRLYAIDAESIWLDEAYTYQRAMLALPQTISVSIEKHHIPTYFVFMHYWVALGDSELMLRLPSALFGALSAAATCLLASVFAGLPVMFVAGALVAIAPVQVYFGQEARMYTLVTLMAAIAMTGLCWLGTHLEQACQPVLGTQRFWPRVSVPPSDAAVSSRPWKRARLSWWAYALGTLAVLYLHNTGVFFVAAELACALVFCLACMPGRRARFAANFVAVNALVFVIWALYLPTLFHQTGEVAGNFWDKFPSWGVFTHIMAQLFLLSARVLSVLGVLLLVLIGAGLWSLRARKGLALGLCALCLVGPALVLLVSLHTPIFGVRIMLWATPPCAVLIALGSEQLLSQLPQLSAASRLGAQLGLVALCGALAWPSLQADYTAITKEPWRPLLADLYARKHENARIIVPSAQEATVLDYYFHRRDAPLPEVPVELVKGKSDVRKHVGSADQVWLIDRKRGTRSAPAKKTLLKQATLGYHKLWQDTIELDEVLLAR